MCVQETTPNISVVVSTYNGGPYIAAQIESILAQDAPNVHVLVRDDGSSDNTLEVLKPYAMRGDIELVEGKNLGVVGSFLDGVARVADSADFVALCDQDDVWHADKLSRALSVLAQKNNGIPQLYCSEYIFCDAEMHPKEKSQLNKSGVSFAKMLYENPTSGNTMVMNRALAQKIAKAGREGVYTHDWWIALVAATLGELAFDDFASLDYRRLSSSVSPTGTSAWNILKYRVKNLLNREELGKITAQLEKLNDCFGGEMSVEKQALLRHFLTAGRLGKAFTRARLRQKPAEDLALRLLFLAGML